jgi:hypothetical protein
MFTITLGLHPEVSFKRADVNFTVDVESLPAEILADLIYHGLTQKIGDAAAGVKDDPDTAKEKMRAVYAALQNGVWGRERSASAGPAWMGYALAIVRSKLGEANKKAYGDIPSDDQKARNAFLRGLYDGLSDTVRGAIDAAAQEQLRIDNEKKQVAKTLGNIGL